MVLIWQAKIVDILLFMVMVTSEKHIDLSLASPFSGGPPVRVKQAEVGKLGGSCAGGEEEDEEGLMIR